MSDITTIHRKRCKRYNIPGHAHYLTFSCYKRQPLLTLSEPRRWLCEAIVEAQRKRPFDLWAYVLMPEHVHLLLWPHEGCKVSEVLRLVKLPVAKRALLWARSENAELLGHMIRSGPKGKTSLRFWQRGGGYDRNLWSPEEIHEKIHYIHANPVRRGLVSRPNEWAYSSWRHWHNADPDDLPGINKESVPLLAR